MSEEKKQRYNSSRRFKGHRRKQSSRWNVSFRESVIKASTREIRENEELSSDSFISPTERDMFVSSLKSTCIDVCGTQLEGANLVATVLSLGGFNAVCEKSLWKDICSGFGITGSDSGLEATWLMRSYDTHLKLYEEFLRSSDITSIASSRFDQIDGRIVAVDFLMWYGEVCGFHGTSKVWDCLLKRFELPTCCEGIIKGMLWSRLGNDGGKETVDVNESEGSYKDSQQRSTNDESVETVFHVKSTSKVKVKGMPEEKRSCEDNVEIILSGCSSSEDNVDMMNEEKITVDDDVVMVEDKNITVDDDVVIAQEKNIIVDDDVVMVEDKNINVNITI